MSAALWKTRAGMVKLTSEVYPTGPITPYIPIVQSGKGKSAPTEHELQENEPEG